MESDSKLKKKELSEAYIAGFRIGYEIGYEDSEELRQYRGDMRLLHLWKIIKKPFNKWRKQRIYR